VLVVTKEFSGERRVSVDVTALQSAVCNGKVLRKAIPKCRQIVVEAPGRFRVQVGIKLGLSEVLLWVEMSCEGVEPIELSIRGEGLASGVTAHMTLAFPDPDPDRITYRGTITLNPFIAGVLRNKLEGAVDRYVQEFIRRLELPHGSNAQTEL
jgi:carbon monoxide dehydrogenase subunit G